MNTIDELNLVKTTTDDGHSCDVRHTVPAIFFSTGGYTGNVYHEFNDGIIPLYITSKHFNKQVVFVILEYHTWWLTKYGDIISHLSDYPPIDFSQTTTTHCFPSAIAGLHIHDELSINPALAPGHPSILDFRRLLDAAYAPRIQSLLPRPEAVHTTTATKPKLVLISRNGSRSITNEAEVVAAAEEVGFSVEVLRPGRTTELAKLYRAVNGSDAVVGVHGAAMTHFLFMRPGTALVQVIPLGTEWAAENYYGGPSVKMGLKYMGYKIWASESSLSEEYKMDDPVLTDPESVNKKGWEVTKKVYLEGQTVNLNITRFRKRLMRVYIYCVAKKKRGWK